MSFLGGAEKRAIKKHAHNKGSERIPAQKHILCIFCWTRSDKSSAIAQMAAQSCYRAPWFDIDCHDAMPVIAVSAAVAQLTASPTVVNGSKLCADTSSCNVARRRLTGPVVWNGTDMHHHSSGNRCCRRLVTIETLPVPPTIQLRGSRCSLLIEETRFGLNKLQQLLRH